MEMRFSNMFMSGWRVLARCYWCNRCADRVREYRVMIRVLFLLTLASVLAGCKSVPPPIPLSGLNAQQARGHGVFQARCGVCHYDRQSGALHGPSLAGIYKNHYLPSGAAATDERVTATIMHGRGMMPPMRNPMDEQELDDLMAYLHTL